MKSLAQCKQFHRGLHIRWLGCVTVGCQTYSW